MWLGDLSDYATKPRDLNGWVKKGEINRFAKNLDSFLPHLVAILVPCEFNGTHLADCVYRLLYAGDLVI